MTAGVYTARQHAGGIFPIVENIYQPFMGREVRRTFQLKKATFTFKTDLCKKHFFLELRVMTILPKHVPYF